MTLFFIASCVLISLLVLFVFAGLAAREPLVVVLGVLDIGYAICAAYYSGRTIGKGAWIFALASVLQMAMAFVGFAGQLVREKWGTSILCLCTLAYYVWALVVVVRP